MESNLPVSLTGFVGRERELAEVGRRLRQVRLVTLTGPGGSGKTRLALELVRALPEEPADGVWFVDLSSLTSQDLVVGALAGAMRLTPAAVPDLAALVSSLGGRQTVLLLDNCEHLVEEVAGVAEALARGCQGLRLLVTSREPLGVHGEWVYRVGPLPEPDSVRLFVNRAQQADAAFRLDAANTEAVAAICRRLDGMPLALELAAAYADALAPAQILGRLDQRFRLLVGGRTAVARHRTLRATVEWSEALLTEAERRLFRRVSVFAGGFDLEAAEAVVSGPDLPAADVLGLLRRLVERSLVLFEQGEGGPRYRLLETLREHALERLAEAGESERLRDAHLAHFVDVAWRQAEDPRGFKLSVFPQHGELGNYRAALAYAHASSSRSFVSLVAWLAFFWLEIRLAEGRSWMETALATQPEDLYIRFRLAWGLGMLTSQQGDFDAAREFDHEALAICERRVDKFGAARVLSNLAGLEFRAGNHDASLGHAKHAERVARETGHSGVLVLALVNLARAQSATGDLDRALVTAEESLAIARELGIPFGLRASLNALVEVRMARGELDLALALQREALRIDQPSAFQEIASLANMVKLLVRTGQAESAVRLAGAVESNQERVGSRLTDALFPEALAEATDAIGVRAVGLLESGRRMSLEEARAFALQEPGSEAPSDVRLTRREVEVARLVHAGMTDSQIAKQLFISPRTAESHVQSLRRKLGVSNRTEVALWAADNLPTSAGGVS